MQGVITSRETTGQTAKEIREEYLATLSGFDLIIEQLNDINKTIEEINNSLR